MARENQMAAKVWNSAFKQIFAANLCLNFGQQITNTLVAKYADYLGAGAVIVGLISSAFAITALVFKIFSGPSIDAFQKKYIAMGAMLVMAVSFFGFSLSQSVEVLFGFRLLQGAGQAFSATCCLAIASEFLPAERFGTGIGYFSLGTAVCQAIAPTSALYIAEFLGYQGAFLMAAVILLIGAGLCSRLPRTCADRRKFKISLSNIIAIEAIVPTGLLFFLSMSYVVINSFLVIYAGEQGVNSNIGLFFTVYAVTMIFTRPFLGKMTDRYGYVVTLIPAMACFALSFLLISMANALQLFLLAAFVSAFGFGACQPALQTLCMKCVPETRRGAGSTMSYIGNDLGNLIGPVIAGALAESFGYSVMWRIMILPIAAAIVLLLLTRNRIIRADNAFREKVSTD
ncbi:MAG: MFS transporter [Clostridiales bacterium]|nr:MFS transporter [Clostridiales bacterium]